MSPRFPVLPARFLPAIIVGLVLLSSCNVAPPETAFQEASMPSPPNYALLAHWSAHPDLMDEADRVPEGLEASNQLEASADVFFIHPTTFMESELWNADLTDAALNESTDGRAVLHQASIFNAAGRVFAPRYRQMVYGGFVSPDTTSERKALLLAYSDVKAAFDHYLETWNEGRPIIIAGHSQGALHGRRLLKEYFDGTMLQKQLIAAYLPGWPIPEDFYEDLPVCDSPEETGCVNSWCTYREGYVPKSIDDFYAHAIVTNPVNWRSDGTPAEKVEHQGFLMENYRTFLSQAVETSRHKGILWVSNPVPLIRMNNYHVGDFNLFWLDVRENAVLRVESFFRQQDQIAEDQD